MDQSLKARLIGATVLVVLAVLLIPELLTGRKASAPATEAPAARDTRTFTIELGRSGGTMSNPTPAPSNSAQGPGSAPAGPLSAAPPGLAPGGRDDASAGPGGVAAAPEDGAAATAPAVPVATSPDPTPPAAVAPVAAAPAPATPSPAEPAGRAAPAAEAGPGDVFLVQVGAFGSFDAARKLVAELQSAGYAAQVAPITRGGKTLYRVRVGPAAGRASARQMAERLQARGLPASVVESD
jgi:cell division septation protein DedD